MKTNNKEQLTKNKGCCSQAWRVAKTLRRLTTTLLFVTFYLLIGTGCQNPLHSPLRPADTNDSNGNGLVRIYIGEDSQTARTVQPDCDALAGYQLTFSPAHDPVNITGGNSAEVALADGTWTITATAYKIDGTIGNSEDAVASGSISITLADGAVSGDISPIILKPIGNDNGALAYDITLDSGVSGYIKLWEINGANLVSGFGTGGTLTLTDSASEDFEIAAGRYIAEVKLTNVDGDIAFLREVIEIWADTTTALVFAPAEYLDPSVALANSKAVLSETDTKIDGKPIGSGTGSGASEQNPKTYTFATTDMENVEFDFVFEVDSLYASVSWTANTGTVPSEYSDAEPPANFSTNNVLWVKAVSEDGSETVYYKFVITPPPPPSNGSFRDTDPAAYQINGTINWTAPFDLTGISGYRIYYGSNETTKLSLVASIPNENILTYTVTGMLPSGAKYFLIYSHNGTDDYPNCLAIPILDLISGDFGGFEISTNNISGISYTAPYLTITQSGTYYITGDSTEISDCIRVLGENITANIILKDVNIDVSGTSDTAAFDTNADNDEGVTVNLTIEGNNILKSGSNKSGLRVFENGALVITEASTGSLDVTGGNGVAGIGGGNGESGGTIRIEGGTVTANGGVASANGTGGAGINGSTVSVTGGTVTATGGAGNAGGGTGINGSTVSVTGGTVTASGGTSNNSYGGTGINGTMINIESGIVTANGSNGRPGGVGINGSTVSIESSTVIANGGPGLYDPAISYGSGGSGGVGISSSGTILINDSTITSNGGNGGNSFSAYGRGGNGGSGINGSSLSITGSMVTATAGFTGGGDNGGNGGNGISSSNISIESSIVTATGRQGTPGNQYGGPGSNGSGIIGTLTEGGNVNNSIIFRDNDGRLYGNAVTLRANATIENGNTLFIPAGRSLSIPAGVTLQNNGTIVNGGTITGTVSGNQPITMDLIVSGGEAYTSYTYRGRSLTITQNGTYTISMRTGLSSTAQNAIAIASNADITLSGVNINMSSIVDVSAFDMTGATVNLTLSGDNVLRSGANRAGLHAPSGATLVITEESTGTLAVTGGSNGAGIGGGSGESGGTISIAGGVIFASSIQGILTEGDNVNDCIVFIGNDGTLYGNVTLQNDVTFTAGMVLTILSENSLTIPAGVILFNNGMIYAAFGGTITGTENITGNPPVFCTISGDAAYTFTEGILTITGDGDYAISNSVYRIVVAPGANANITLSDANIDVSGTANSCAFDMTGGAVNLTLIGDNVLRSGANRAGLEVPDGATLVIIAESTGSLNATGGQYSAGIGGVRSGSGGTISIAGGTITATGGQNNGSGIGFGYQGNGGTVTITGGTVAATGGTGANNLGYGISGTTISIAGSTVTVNGNGSAVGISGATTVQDNAVIFATSIGSTLTEGNNVADSIIFIGNTGTLYGDVVLQQDVTFAAGRVLTIRDEKSLTIPADVTLTNNGTINVETGGTVTGTVTGNQPVYQ